MFWNGRIGSVRKDRFLGFFTQVDLDPQISCRAAAPRCCWALTVPRNLVSIRADVQPVLDLTSEAPPCFSGSGGDSHDPGA